MNLPYNGRIIIVDDKIAEAQPLINILSKKRIPFNYYSGTNSDDFPVDPNENKIRILFLDLNIFELTQEAKQVISSIHPILESLIPDNPNPYLLVIWSKKPDVYKDALETHFATSLVHKTPAKIVFLHKGKYFDYNEGEWHPQADCLERIENDLNNELDNISILRNLINWENIVHNESSNTTNEFSSFYPIDDNWDKNLKAIIYKLAKCVIGTDDIGLASNDQKLAKAFLNVNAFLFDKLESEIDNLQLGPVEGIPNRDEDANITSNIQAKINSTLHISKRPPLITSFEQGNIYEIPDTNNFINKIIWEKLFSPANPNKLNEIRQSNPSLIQLDITPVCDYSQDKKYIRLIHGIIINPQFVKHFKSNFFYPCPLMEIANHEKCFVFDFRHIITVSKEFINQQKIPPIMKLRREICTDIQSQLSNQINRPGISNL